MMLLDPNDNLRRIFNLGTKTAEKILRKNVSFVIPAPALGEAVMKVRDKRPDKFLDDMAELDRLLKTGLLNLSYIHNPTGVYYWAKRLSEMDNDDRDTISPMDALIAGTAIADPDSTTFYTVDSLLTNSSMWDDVAEWRNDRGMRKISVSGIEDVIRTKK